MKKRRAWRLLKKRGTKWQKLKRPASETQTGKQNRNQQQQFVYMHVSASEGRAVDWDHVKNAGNKID